MDQFVRHVQGKYNLHANDKTPFSAKFLFYVQMSLTVFVLMTTGVVRTLTPRPSCAACLPIGCGTLAPLSASVCIAPTSRCHWAFWATVSLLFAGPLVSMPAAAVALCRAKQNGRNRASVAEGLYAIALTDDAR